MASNPLVKQNPYLLLTEINDLRIRQNFQNLSDYFTANNQLLGFKFFELSFTKAQTNFTMAHGFAYIPLDVLVTQITGGGIVTFNYGLFDKTNVNITVTGACRLRFFVGLYFNQVSALNSNKTDSWTVNPSATSGASSNYLAVKVTVNAPYALTNTNTQAVWFSGSGLQTVTMPDATTCTVGQAFTLYNRSDSVMTINNASNLLLQTIIPSQTKGILTLTCTDNSSKSGIWGLTIQQGDCYWSGYHTDGTGASGQSVVPSNGSWGDAASSSTLVKLVVDKNYNFGTVISTTSAANPSLATMGLFFSWPATGYYRVEAGLVAYSDSQGAGYRLTDGVTTFDAGMNYGNTGDHMSRMVLSTVIKVTDITVKQTIKVQEVNLGNHGYYYGLELSTAADTGGRYFMNINWQINKVGDL